MHVNHSVNPSGFGSKLLRVKASVDVAAAGMATVGYKEKGSCIPPGLMLHPPQYPQQPSLTPYFPIIHSQGDDSDAVCTLRALSLTHTLFKAFFWPPCPDLLHWGTPGESWVLCPYRVPNVRVQRQGGRKVYFHKKRIHGMFSLQWLAVLPCLGPGGIMCFPITLRRSLCCTVFHDWYFSASVFWHN